MSFLYTPRRRKWRGVSSKRVLEKVDSNFHWRGHLPLAFMLEWNRFIASLKDHRPALKGGALC